MSTLPARPGDVLAVWTSASFVDDMIRVGEALEGKPAVANHVVIVTHKDKKNRWMGIQGQPGGVGLVDCTPFLSDSRTRSNYAQPRDEQDDKLTIFLATCAKSLGIKYDWVGIEEDGLDALHLQNLSDVLDSLWQWPSQHDLLPGHVVCSSLGADVYEVVEWKHPDMGKERVCEPADWWNWSDKELWK